MDEKKTVKKDTITTTMAKATIEQERRTRMERVGRAIDQVLKKENCRLEAIVTIQGKQIISRVAVIPIN